ncbi:unnamed protein product, partial [Nesidiocoris tenuis]
IVHPAGSPEPKDRSPEDFTRGLERLTVKSTRMGKPRGYLAKTPTKLTFIGYEGSSRRLLEVYLFFDSEQHSIANNQCGY